MCQPAAGPEEQPTGRPELHVVPDPDADRKAIAAAGAAGRDRAGGRPATESLASAASDVADLEARSLQVQGEQIDELRRRIAELETSLEEVDDELGDVEDVRAEAEAALAAATKERDAGRCPGRAEQDRTARSPSPSTGSRPRSTGRGGVAPGPVGFGSNRRSSCQVSRRSSVEDHTPVPRPGEERGAQRGGLHDPRTLDRDADLVGLDLAQQVVGAGAAVHAQRRQTGHRLQHVAHLEGDRLQRPHDVGAGSPAGQADDQPLARAGPSAERRARSAPGRTRPRGVRHRRGDGGRLRRRPDDLEPVAQPLHGRPGHEDRALQGVGRGPRPASAAPPSSTRAEHQRGPVLVRMNDPVP